MRYLVVKKQVGEGCDYTIGCGMAYEFIDAGSIEGLAEKILWPDGRDEGFALVGEQALCEVFYVPWDFGYSLDIQYHREQYLEAQRLLAEEREAKKEQEELKRLKEKYP